MTVFSLLKQNSSVDGAKELLFHVLNLDATSYLQRKDEEVSEQDEKVFLEGISQLKSHKPLQYITHCAPFFGRWFYVDENVLIPRFDTEIIVEEALKSCDHGRVLDLCTGSGCIGITLKLENPKLSVLCSDLSEKALTVAAKNAESLNADVGFAQGDLFDPICENFDMIVSNPPYISHEEMKTLDAEVKDHEPNMALESADDGLYHIKRIIKEGERYLHEGGWLLLEIGDTQGDAVSQLMKNEGYTDVMVVCDLAGKSRVVKGRNHR